MNQSYTKAEHQHIERIKSMACAVCDNPAPSEAHHIRQNLAYSCIPLCADCHRNNLLGWHGQRSAWKVRKMDELDALAKTIERL